MATLYNFFLEGLYNHPWLKKAIFVLFVERNISAGPYVIEQVTQAKYSRHYIITDTIRGVSGWWTDRHMKSEYVISGAEQFRENKICILIDFICKNPWMDAKIRASQTLDGLFEEIPRFRLREAAPGSNRKTPIMSGKIDEHGKKIKGMNDDKAFTLFMLMYILNGILKENIPGIDYKYIKQESGGMYY